MAIARFLFWLFCLSLFACQFAVPLLAGRNLNYSARMFALACWLTDNFLWLGFNCSVFFSKNLSSIFVRILLSL